jgi:hypothetical protein
MITTSVLVGTGLLALLFLIRLAKGRSSTINSLDDLTERLRPVDVEAFRNLVDPDEEEFLRTSLPPTEFRAIHRERLHAAVDYISCAAQNAAVLLRLGEAARQSPDPAIAEAGETLVDSAIRLRLYAFHAMGRIYLGILLPGVRLSPVSIAESYERMTGLVIQLGRLQYPATGARVAAVL